MRKPSSIFYFILLILVSLTMKAMATKPTVLPNLRTDPEAIKLASIDFGMLVNSPPIGVLEPRSTSDLAALINSSYSSNHPFTIAARGHGHSAHGQSLALDGVVVNMTTLGGGGGGGRINISSAPPNYYADVGGEQLWVDVLQATLQQGLAPKSWTDYLYLTVGGTLSNAGVSGQAFRVGPQISNVYEMDIITGKGESITCSKEHNSDLFYAVLGGLGQFGIITRARIALEPAPERARWLHLLYNDFSAFTRDQEHLISLQDNGFDYIEGMVISNHSLISSYSSINDCDFTRAFATNNDGLIYSLEVTKYYNSHSNVDQEVNALLQGLSFMPGAVISNDTTYFDFLNRVYKEEQVLRAAGLWAVPHPWLNFFVPRSRISDIDTGIFRGIAKDDLTSGPIIIYPTNRNKWDDKTSVVIPDEDMFYVIAMLRSAVKDWERLEEQNKQIMNFLNGAGIGFKQYLAHYKTSAEWQQHFGSKWYTFSKMKMEFDPRKILSPGQMIFN